MTIGMSISDAKELENSLSMLVVSIVFFFIFKGISKKFEKFKIIMKPLKIFFILAISSSSISILKMFIGNGIYNLIEIVWIIGTIYFIYVVIKGDSNTGHLKDLINIKSLIKGDFKSIMDIKKHRESSAIIFGKTEKTGKVICKLDNETGHVAIFGGSQTGKSTSVAMPTLLEWEGSAFIIDVKKELHPSTSGYREKQFKNKIYAFDIDDENCDCYDPLALVNDVMSASELARNMIPTPKEGDPFWAESSQGILAAAIIDGKEKGETFGEICKKILITSPQVLVSKLIKSKNEDVSLLASVGNDAEDKTIKNIFSTLRTNLQIYASDKNIQRATRKSDWTPKTLEEKATIYIKIADGNVEQYSGILRVIISQTLRYLTTRKDRRQPAILMLLDELAQLGKVHGLRKAMGTLASRNVHIVPMLQSLSDLDVNYSKDERKVMLDNCRYIAILGISDGDTREYFSKLAGTHKIWQKSYNNGGLIGLNKGDTDSQVEERIFKPEEFGQIREDKKVILFGFRKAMRLDKLFYYESPKYNKIVKTYKL